MQVFPETNNELVGMTFTHENVEKETKPNLPFFSPFWAARVICKDDLARHEGVKTMT